MNLMLPPEALRAEGIRRMQTPTAHKEVQEYAIGTWESMTFELRPT